MLALVITTRRAKNKLHEVFTIRSLTRRLGRNETPLLATRKCARKATIEELEMFDNKELLKIFRRPDSVIGRSESTTYPNKFFSLPDRRDEPKLSPKRCSPRIVKRGEATLETWCGLSLEMRTTPYLDIIWMYRLSYENHIRNLKTANDAHGFETLKI